MTRLLITGASGLLGANLVLELVERYEIIGVTHSVRLLHPRLDSRQADLAAPGVARRLFQEVRPDVVVHCAAATDVEACERDPGLAHRLNAEMAEVVAQAAAETGARLLHLSTDAVFDGEGGPYGEDHLPAPVNVYGKSKLAGEEAVRAAHPGALVVRTNFFGWNAKPKLNLAEWFLDRLRSGQGAPGFTDVYCSPMLVNDLAGLLDALLRTDVRGVLHLPGRDCLSKYEFGCRLARAFGFREDLVVASDLSQAGFRAPRPRRTCLEGTKARGILGIDLPSVDLGLRRLESLARTGNLQRLREMAAT